MFYFKVILVTVVLSVILALDIYRIKKGNKVCIYIDLDGVLFSPVINPFVVRTEPWNVDFYMLSLVRKLRETTRYKICFLCSAFDEHSVCEIRDVLRKTGVGDISKIFVPYGYNKADFINNEAAILIDDSTYELFHWQKRPGLVGIKYYNGFNGTHGNWARLNGLSISRDMSIDDAFNFIVNRAGELQNIVNSYTM